MSSWLKNFSTVSRGISSAATFAALTSHLATIACRAANAFSSAVCRRRRIVGLVAAAVLAVAAAVVLAAAVFAAA